jgi:nitrite reductase/ring-hydroxylating ferredoxin subunit/uncharacterized membrane protein
MLLIDRLEQAIRLDPVVSAGQRVARLIRPAKVRDALHGVWLGHPLHPVLAQATIGAWLSASVLDFAGSHEDEARLLTALGVAAAAPTALAGVTDWSEQHEQQMRVGVVHAAGNVLALGLYAASLAGPGSRRARWLRLGGMVVAGASAYLGGHLAYRLAGGVNHAEDVPHLIEPGWHDLMRSADLPEGEPVRQVVGEVPVVAVRSGGDIYVLADRCSHMSGPLSGGDLSGQGLFSQDEDGGCLTCPWHGSTFRLADGSVVRGPATAPQPAFEVREAGGVIQVMLPGAG